MDPVCNDPPPSPNGGKFEKGCAGAVYSDGSISEAYCLNTADWAPGAYPWWKRCCKLVWSRFHSKYRDPNVFNEFHLRLQKP